VTKAGSVQATVCDSPLPPPLFFFLSKPRYFRSTLLGHQVFGPLHHGQLACLLPTNPVSLGGFGTGPSSFFYLFFRGFSSNGARQRCNNFPCSTLSVWRRFFSRDSHDLFLFRVPAVLPSLFYPRFFPPPLKASPIAERVPPLSVRIPHPHSNPSDMPILLPLISPLLWILTKSSRFVFVHFPASTPVPLTFLRPPHIDRPPLPPPTT